MNYSRVRNSHSLRKFTKNSRLGQSWTSLMTSRLSRHFTTSYLKSPLAELLYLKVARRRNNARKVTTQCTWMTTTKWRKAFTSINTPSTTPAKSSYFTVWPARYPSTLSCRRQKTSCVKFAKMNKQFFTVLMTNRTFVKIVTRMFMSKAVAAKTMTTFGSTSECISAMLRRTSGSVRTHSTMIKKMSTTVSRPQRLIVSNALSKVPRKQKLGFLAISFRTLLLKSKKPTPPARMKRKRWMWLWRRRWII